MASGGMYDHIGGGFARYSVDREWLVPHFEKMLYDQALLVRAYLHGSAVLGHDRDGARSSTRRSTYVLRDLRHPDGGFYSAEDADSPDEHGHGHEGLFHTWTPDEVRAVLGATDADVDAVLDWYGITDGRQLRGPLDPEPARTHRGELARPPAIEDGAPAAVRGPRSAAAPAARRQGAHRVERADASPRWPRPARCSAAPTGSQAAVDNGEFLLRELRRPDGRWHRTWQADGDAAGPPRRARRRPRRARRRLHPPRPRRPARRAGSTTRRDVADTMLDHFWDVDHGGLFTTRRRRRGARRPPEGPLRQRHAVGQLDRRRRAVRASPRSPASRATPTTPTASCSCSAP